MEQLCQIRGDFLPSVSNEIVILFLLLQFGLLFLNIGVIAILNVLHKGLTGGVVIVLQRLQGISQRKPDD